MSTTVELVVKESVARVTFRSERGINILSAETRLELKQVLTTLEKSKDCRVVIFRAEGKTFLAGADLHELQHLNNRTAFEFAREGQLLFERIAALKAVTVAAIQGACAGGGFELALACDFRIASDKARIGLPEVTLGIVPGWGGTVRTTLLMGGMIAKRVVLTGQLFDALEAHSLKLVHEICREEHFEQVLDNVVRHLLKAGPLATAAAQHIIESTLSHNIDELLRMEAEQFAACFDSDEPTEGTSAFLAKRPTRWSDVPGHNSSPESSG